MRWFKVSLGVLLVLMGAVWTLQGLNVLGGSGMSGHSFWGWAGVAVGLVGIGVICIALPKPKAK